MSRLRIIIQIVLLIAMLFTGPLMWSIKTEAERITTRKIELWEQIEATERIAQALRQERREEVDHPHDSPAISPTDQCC